MEKTRHITGSLERELSQSNKKQDESDQHPNSDSETGHRVIGPVPQAIQGFAAMIVGCVDRCRCFFGVAQLGLSSMSARTVA